MAQQAPICAHSHTPDAVVRKLSSVTSSRHLPITGTNHENPPGQPPAEAPPCTKQQEVLPKSTSARAIKVLGWNINGRMHAQDALTAARNQRADIVMLQETHGLTKADIENFAKLNGFKAFISPAPADDAGAGVAICLRSETESIENRQATARVLVEGRFLEVEVVINGRVSTVYSIYSCRTPADTGVG